MAIEYDWLEAMDSTTVYAYRFEAEQFVPFGARAHAWVATEAVAPIGPPEAIGQLIDLHEEAGIELRLLDELWPLWDAVIGSTLEFSGIRLHNAQPRRSYSRMEAGR